MAAHQVPWISPEQFLEQETIAETRHIYYCGVVTAMAGGSPAHSFLAMNLGGELRSQLRGSGCRVAGSDLLFQTGTAELYTYPDVMVLCGRIETMPGRPNVVTNPVFVAEVLSPCTAGFDRGEKSREYRMTPSIRQYALLSVEKPLVELHTRADDGRWWISEVAGMEGELELTSLSCRVPMAGLYEGVLENLTEI